MKVNGKDIKPVFIIGHGRSGTHFIGGILSGHNEIYATVEEKDWFRSFSEVAFNPEKNLKIVPKLIDKQIKHLKRKCFKPVWMDKTHPFVLLKKVVEEYYPEALLIHVIRNPFDLYCSAIRHNGVMNWFKRHNEVFGKGGNIFLGTDANIEKNYHLLKDTQKIAYRWISWVKSGLKWEEESENVITVNYENMVTDVTRTFTDVTKFIGVSTSSEWFEFIERTAKSSSVNRYKKEMTESEVDEMNMILEEFLKNNKQLRQYSIKW